MMLLSKRALLAVAAVVDVAMHARPSPVAAKALAGRHNLPPRHLETLLQSLVRANILKGVRGPKGGYELARERRRITMGEIVRVAILSEESDDATAANSSKLISTVVGPMVAEAGESLIAALDAVTVEDLCKRSQHAGVFEGARTAVDFTI
ncbi:MAG: Rrf2 family transcriptional regulator [Beijerinckiaceae bacterium]|nr:Rrf2 family transcriptional regulator [Beijerinckiaceae bacterium]